MLRKRPGFTLAALLSLVLGIGANTTIFTLVNAVFLRSLPMRDPARLVSIYGTDEAAGRGSGFYRFSYLNYLDYRQASHTFSGILAYQGFAIGLSGGGRPERIVGRAVSGNYFDVLGVEATLGRTFRPEEDGAPGAHPVAVIGYGLWSRRFGADPRTVGSTVLLNGHPFTVIGVLPREFHDLERTRAADVWVPLAMSDQVSPFAKNLPKRGVGMLFLVGRLAPGATLAQAASEMKTIAQRLEREYPDENEKEGAVVVPLSEAAVGPDQRGLFLKAGRLLMAAVGLILLVACVTVATLLVARAQSRRGEITVRLALGVSRGRLVRQLLTESVLLFLLGGLLSLPLATATLRFLWKRFHPLQFHENALDLQLDPPILLFTLGIALVTGLLFGLVPALHASKPDLAGTLRAHTGSSADERGGWLGLRGLLVVIQIGLTVVSLIGAGLFLRSLGNAQRIDLGFESEKLLLFSFDLGAASYKEPRGRQFFRSILERVEHLPGVASASLAQVPPLKAPINRKRVTVESQDPGRGKDKGPYIYTNSVDSRYFETMGIPILRGRAFTEADRADAPPVAVINETLARRYWPGQDPLGQRFRFDDETSPIEVVGIARNSRYETVGEEPRPYIYLPLLERYAGAVTLHVRTAGDPALLLPTVQREVQSLDPDLPYYDVRTAAALLRDALWGPRMAAVLLSLFATLALILTIVGVYGVMAYLAGERRQEIGIRLVLGARRQDVLSRFLGRAALLVAIGTLAGAVGALAFTRTLAGLLYGVSATDLTTFVAVPLLLAAVALAASYLPVSRALRAAPFAALRE
jgi:putative ABC transport system permease protein